MDPSNKSTPLAPCQLGRMCQNPLCPRCFPNLGDGSGSSSTHREAWGSSNNASLSTLPPSMTPIPRAISADLVELVVVLCTRDGTRRSVLQAIRCGSEEPLARIRTLLKAEIPSLPLEYSFLRIVGGHVVQLTADQESGRKAYKAKHFCPPVTERPYLLLYDRAPAAIQETGTIPRQVSHDIVEFSVRRLTEGQQRGDSQGVGMIRLHRDATLREIRQDLADLLSIQDRYRFVRMLHGQVTLLTAAQERGEKPLRAYHFAPPYTAQPEIVLLAQKTYTEGQVVEDETKMRELKSLRLALPNRPTAKGRNPRDMVKDKAPTYINSFLNSAGGVLLLGVSDEGVVERVSIAGALDDCSASLDTRVALARSVKDDIRKLVDGICINMDPVVDDDLVSTLFVPVRKLVPGDNKAVPTTNDKVLLAEEEIYCLIEIHVKPGRRSLYFLNKHSLDAYERREGSTHLMDSGTITGALNQGGETGWRGGWRQLCSPFDFDKLMRRLSEPWAGREWLFAATRQVLFHQMDGPSCAKFGVVITGSRGMGKTSFLSELALRPKHVTHIHVVAHHLCRVDDPDTLNPGLFVHSLAAMLAHEFREYRAIMIGPSVYPDGDDSIGATMLRALRLEHCEKDPDDAFLRGILRPLQKLDFRRNQDKQQTQAKVGMPLAVLVDAIAESLAADSGTSRNGSGSTTIAHLLEQGLAQSGGLPPWIKFIVSYRQEMTDVSGPIQRLAGRLSLIDLDPDPSCEVEVQQARYDIRLFVDAFIESTRMTSPFSCHVGKGVWTTDLARLASQKLRVLGGDKCIQWQIEAKPGEWVPLESSVASDLDYCQKMDQKNAYCALGKQVFLADLTARTWRNLKSGKEQAMRPVDVEESMAENGGSGSMGASTAGSRSQAATEPTIVDLSAAEGQKCFYCNQNGHFKRYCPKRRAEEVEARRDRLTALKRENELLGALATNSEGNYLYARSVLEDFFHLLLLGGSNTDAGADSFQGESRIPTLRTVKPVLEVLLAASKRGVTEREITHAVVAGGGCDPTSVPFCLRDIQWALDIDSSGRLPRYSLRHESIRTWLREEGKQSMFGLAEQQGHAFLAASLLQRCWPQQAALLSWLQTETAASSTSWYQWNGWVPNDEDEDVFNLVVHLLLSDLGGDNERTELLKTVGKRNLDSVYRGKTTALHSACATENMKAVTLLVNAGASPNESVRGRRPLHVAASKGHSKMCELLLSSGADVSLATTTSGRTALLNAVCSGSVSTVNCILAWIARSDCSELVDVSQTDTGRTPLSIAVEEGYDEIVRLLLSAKASIYLADRWGRTPIYYAALYGRAKGDTVKLLACTPRGQDTLKWGESGHNRSPLHAAVWRGHWDVVRALLDVNADPNLVDENGDSPLHEAAYFGSYGHERGDIRRAKLSDETSRRQSELNAAAYCESVRLEILQRLLASGRCVVDLRDAHGCTPLWYATGGGWTSAVKALLDAGAIVNPCERSRLPHTGRIGPTPPLLYALERGHYEVAKILLDRGARIPESCSVDAICSSYGELPHELVDRIRAARQETRLPTNSYGPEHDEVSNTLATRCTPVPKDAFAQAPISR